MFRQVFTRVGVPAVVAAVLLMAGPAWARGAGGHAGGFRGGISHVGGFHAGSFHAGGFRSGSFRAGGLRANGFRGSRFYGGGYYPGYYFGYYPSYSYYPSYGDYAPYGSYQAYDLGDGSALDLGSTDSYGEVAPSYSSGYQELEPTSVVSPETPSARADSPAYVTVNVPANAAVWFEGTKTTTTGAVREYQSPPLRPGRYTYAIRARWTENGRAVTQTQNVPVSPGSHISVDFPIRSGTK
jgi:uncharacterized protein (TIGR03000 family)